MANLFWASRLSSALLVISALMVCVPCKKIVLNDQRLDVQPISTAKVPVKTSTPRKCLVLCDDSADCVSVNAKFDATAKEMICELLDKSMLQSSGKVKDAENWTFLQRTGDEDNVQTTAGPAPTEPPSNGNCKNDNPDCARWASIGECAANPGYMYVKCKLSCNKCDDGSVNPGCVDDNEWCPGWAATGECEKNPDYMLYKCKRSCSTCGNCKNDHADCAYWASIGECDANPSYMHVKCKLSCNKCGDCKNDHKDCAHWASIGECDANPGYMHVKCKLSCNKCDK